MKIETLRTERFPMDYFRFGYGGKNLVILPGLSLRSVMGAAEAIAEAYRPLEDRYTIWVFDRRGNLPEEYPVTEMAEDTAEALHLLGLEKLCVFGASQGGMIALCIAVRHPELVEKLVLGSSSARVEEAQYRVIEAWARLAEAGDRRGLCLAFGRDVYPPAVFEACRQLLLDTAASLTEEELARFVILARGTRGFDLTAELERLRCPVLAIGVVEDEVLDSDATMEIAERLEQKPDFRLYMYAGYGHAAFDTAPDYKQRILRFLEA